MMNAEIVIMGKQVFNMLLYIYILDFKVSDL